MSRPLLTPLGTARAALLEAEREGSTSTRDTFPRDTFPRDTFPRDLAELARAADLGEERLHLAWELARLAGDRDPERARARLVLMLLLFDAIAAGSTRLPLGASSRSRLRARGAALGLGAKDLRRAECLADAIVGTADSRPTEGGAGRSGAADGGGRQLSLALDTVALDTVALDTVALDTVALDASSEDPRGSLIGEVGSGAEPGASASRRPLILDREALAPQRLRALEERLARRLRDRAVATVAVPRPSPVAIADPAAIDRALAALHADPVHGARGVIALTAEQESAVRAALGAAVSVISGGPGTGKTSVVVSILRALARIDPRVTIALAAPTGKAADRLAQSITAALDRCRDPVDVELRARLPEARTLHRLLGWSPGQERFRHHEASPLAEQVVIVDEASMIDLALMDHLVAALGAGARLVLLGDADQLPSVDPGAVLADLVSSEGAASIAISRLTVSHRMDPSDRAGSHVLGIAQRVNGGLSPPLSERPLEPGAIARLRAPSAEGLDPEGVALFAPRDARAREALLAWWWEHRVAPEADRRLIDRTLSLTDPGDRPLLDRLFSRLDAARLLCVTRGRPTGTDAINAWMGARAARERRVMPSSFLLVGEPVMVVRNAYDEGLFNGDQGLVLWIADAGAAARPMLVVRRGGAYVGHRLDAVRPLLERAYATTVHKAQGSEHDAVMLVLPDEDVPRLLTREILYTAITRARRSVTLVGEPALLTRAVSRAASRDTALATHLREPRQGSA
jgi:exodeoxyribonuclease V alpha subunit